MHHTPCTAAHNPALLIINAVHRRLEPRARPDRSYGYVQPQELRDVDLGYGVPPVVIGRAQVADAVHATVDVDVSFAVAGSQVSRHFGTPGTGNVGTELVVLFSPWSRIITSRNGNKKVEA